MSFPGDMGAGHYMPAPLPLEPLAQHPGAKRRGNPPPTKAAVEGFFLFDEVNRRLPSPWIRRGL
jgi:hypothetical protein